MPGLSGRVTTTQLGAPRAIAAAIRGAARLARIVLGVTLLLSSVAVLLGIAGRARPRGEAAAAAVPMRIDCLETGLALGSDRFLDPESGLPVVAVVPGRGTLRNASWAPWRDEGGRTRLVGLWDGAPPGRRCEFALVRLSQPDGAVLDRISREDLPGWVGAPCWFPDRSDRVLLAGGDGRLYRLDFGGDDARGPWPWPLPWRGGGEAPRIARLGDLSWPGGAQLGGRVVVASLYLMPVRRRSGPDERSIWWIRLDAGAEAVVAARPLVLRVEPAASPGDDARLPVLSPGPGRPALAWLERARDRHDDPWRLRVAPVEVDPRSGDPFVLAGTARTLATDCAFAAPMFGADGAWIAYVPSSPMRSPSVRRLPLPAPAENRAGARATEIIPAGG
jgi:hypothetical protein